MLFEKDFLSLVQSKLDGICGVFFQQAPQDAAEPFAVLSTITASGAVEVDVQRPWVQLDVYAATQFAAVELAEAAVEAVQFHSGRTGGTLFEGVKAERRAMIGCEDGTWKVPIDIRFYCRRIR